MEERGREANVSMREWAARARKGDDEAFAQLADSCKERLYRVAYAYLKNEPDALEAVQETVCRAYMKIRKLKEPEHFLTWITRILLNCCADETKRRSRAGGELADYDAAVWDRGADPDLQAAIAGLEPKYRRIVVLMYFEGYTLTEIARILELPDGTVKTRLHKALAELRRHLGEGEWNHA